MNLKGILEVIEKAHKLGKTSIPYVCGGVPRDKYLKKLKNISDLDLTTGDSSIQKLSYETKSILSRYANIEYKQMKDGHTSIFINNIKIDFSSNFIVPNIENYLSISNPTNMDKEIYSRDFFCNTLLLSLDLKYILDPTNNAINSLDSKIIKTCLAPEVTLVNSKNRVIRAIYLACKLDFEISDDIKSFVRNNPDSLYISTPKVLKEKYNSAKKYNYNKAISLVKEMNLSSRLYKI